MSNFDPDVHIIRPFGLIGGRYAVDDAGFRKYWLAWIVAGVGCALVLFNEGLGVPLNLAIVGALVATVIAFALCADIVRKGRKL